MELKTLSSIAAPRAARPLPAVAPAKEPASKMSVDVFERSLEGLPEPIEDLVESADNKKEFKKVVTEQTTDVFALRSSAHVPLTAKKVVDATKVASKAIAAKPVTAPTGPTGMWGKMGTGLNFIDIGAGLFQTLTGISELRVGKTRDGLVNVSGGAFFAGSSILYLAGSTVAAPVTAALSAFIPGINELAYGLKQGDVKKQLSGGALIAGGVGFSAMAGIAMTGIGAGATVLGLPVMGAIGVATSALLIGRAVHGNWSGIKDMAGRIGKRLGLG
jgi:hypothetical protein